MPSKGGPRNNTPIVLQLLPCFASQSVPGTGETPRYTVFLSALRNTHYLGEKIRPENCCYGLCFVEVKMLEQKSDCLIAPSLSPSLHLLLSPPLPELSLSPTPHFSTLPSSVSWAPSPASAPGRRKALQVVNET